MTKNEAPHARTANSSQVEGRALGKPINKPLENLEKEIELEFSFCYLPSLLEFEFIHNLTTAADDLCIVTLSRGLK